MCCRDCFAFARNDRKRKDRNDSDNKLAITCVIDVLDELGY